MPATDVLPLLLATPALLTLLSATVPPGAPPAVAPPLYPERNRLLVLREPGRAERSITTRAEWARRRAQILAAMQQVMGPLPGPEARVPLAVEVEWERPAEGYRLRKLTYAAAPGERVPAYLLLPDGARGRRPGMLCLHQTTSAGKDEPAGLAGNPNLHYARELARRGYVCLVPEYATFGEHQLDVYARGWQSGSMKAIWDNIRGVDLLQGLAEVRADRLGAIGHSLGGHNALFTAAFEPRLKAVVSNCGFCSFSRYMGGDIAGWSGPRYMPRIATHYPTPAHMPWDFQDVVAALAPRAFLAIAPLRDDNFAVEGVREVMAAAAPVYALFRVPEKLAAEYPDCAHEWPAPQRELAYRWLDRWLRR